MAHAADQAAQLQPDEQEHRVLEQELHRAPVAVLGDPRARRLQLRRTVTEIQPGDHDGQHAGRVDLLGGQERDVRRGERQRGVEHRIVDLLADERKHERRAPHRSAARRRPRAGSPSRSPTR